MSQPLSGEIVPDKLWLSHIIVILRQTEKQTGMSFMAFLEMLEEQDDTIDLYDDRTITRAVQKYLKKTYPDSNTPPRNISNS